MIAGLDIAGRAELLGITCREAVDLAKAHRELFTYPVSDSIGALARIRRWNEAGRPAADFSRLVYLGDGGVYAILIATLAKLPAALAWHAAEHVAWLEVGRNAGAWTTCAPLMRVPAGDTAHLVVISGAEQDERMPHIITHELAHSWHRALFSDATRGVPLPPQERLARNLATVGYDADALAREFWREEVLADQTAAALGFPSSSHSSDHVRLRGFEAEITASRDRIAAINTGEK
jgi:hypothetical protein